MAELLDEEETSKPKFTINEIENIITNYYPISIKKYKLLPSYDDQNTKITSTDNEEFVFKITSTKQSFLDVVHYVTDKLDKSLDYSISPRVILNNDNQSVFEVSKESKKYRCVMISFVQGTTLYELNPSSMNELDKIEIYKQIGKELAIMDRILSRECDHNGSKRVLHYWDLARTMEVYPLIHNIVDNNKREMVENILNDFNNLFMPRIGEFRKSIIQNDANSCNIIVNKGINDNEWNVGFIDFLDMIYSCTIFEISTCLAYTMQTHKNPFPVAKALLGSYHKEFPLSDMEIEVLPLLIKGRLVTSLTLSAQKRHTEPENEYLFINEKSGWDLLETLCSIDNESIVSIFKSVCSEQFNLPTLSISPDDIILQRNQYLSQNLSIAYSPNPLKIVRGFMQYLYDENGTEYLDCINNVCHVGHCHPKVVTYAQKQLSLLNTNTRYLHDYIVQYSKKLCDTFPEPLTVCFLVCSGSEANELALRLAKCHTNKNNFIVMDHGYHGNTASLVGLSPYKCEGPGGNGLASNIRKIPLPNQFLDQDDNLVTKYKNLALEKVKELENSGGIAGFIAESIMGCAGQVVFPDGYLKEIYSLIRSYNGVCIADEVQVGFGRCGKSWWAFETQNVIPDIVTLGKPMGNGHPIGAVITTKEIANSFHNGMEYFNTFGGNPVSCITGLGVLEIIESENLINHANIEGEYLLQEFKKLQDAYEFIGDVRGMGFYIGIEIVKSKECKKPDADKAKLIVLKLKENHILLSTDGPNHNVIKMKPPMVFSRNNSNHLINILTNICKNI